MRLAGWLISVCGVVGRCGSTDRSRSSGCRCRWRRWRRRRVRCALCAMRCRGGRLSVVGPRGALLGEQSGVLEGWIFPWKLFSGLRMSVKMADYPVPIDVNEMASSIDVQPDHTTITYAHANFTIRQVMFAPSVAADGLGVAAYF